MEKQTQRRPKRLWSEEDKRIRQEIINIEQQRLEKENEAVKKMEQQVEEEEEKMREECQQIVQPYKLTDEQKYIRKVIYRRDSYHRLQLLRAAEDENFRQRVEARRQRGEEPKKVTPRIMLRELTVEQKKPRKMLKAKASRNRTKETRDRYNKRAKARYHRRRAEKIQRGEIKPRRTRRNISPEADRTAHTETATEEGNAKTDNGGECDSRKDEEMPST